jgi:hypothetical protein
MPWWAQSVDPQLIAPFADSTTASPSPTPTDNSTPDVASEGWLGSVLGKRGTASAPTSGGILHGAVPDTSQDALPATAFASLPALLPFGPSISNPLTTFHLSAGGSSPSPLALLWNGSPSLPPQGSGQFRASENNASLALPQVSLDPRQAPIFGPVGAVGSDGAVPRRVTQTTSPVPRPLLDSSNISNVRFPAPNRFATPASGPDPQWDVGSLAGDPTGLDANRQDPAGGKASFAPNPAPSGDDRDGPAPVDTAPDPAFALAYEQAQRLIVSDPDMQRALDLAERAGDKDFSNRLAAIVANLDLDPEAARNAIWREVFASQMRRENLPSAANWYLASAIQDAAKRLEVLRPGFDIGWASDDASQAIRELTTDQQRVFSTIVATPGITWREKWKRLGEAGLVDSAIASGPAGDSLGLLHALGGGILAAGGPPGGFGPRRSSKGRSVLDPANPELLDAAEIARRSRADDRREERGMATAGEAELEQPWSTGKREMSIAKQVADRLRGRHFTNWGRFREAHWRTVADTPELAAEFSPQNRALMEKGKAPGVLKSERLGEQRKYHIHHIKELEHGGDVYNLDNMKIVTPLRHDEIHYGPMRSNKLKPE